MFHLWIAAVSPHQCALSFSQAHSCNHRIFTVADIATDVTAGDGKKLIHFFKFIFSASSLTHSFPLFHHPPPSLLDFSISPQFRAEYDNANVSAAAFDQHLSRVHDIWNYVLYISYLMDKDKTECVHPPIRRFPTPQLSLENVYNLTTARFPCSLLLLLLLLLRNGLADSTAWNPSFMLASKWTTSVGSRIARLQVSSLFKKPQGTVSQGAAQRLTWARSRSNGSLGVS